MRRWATPLSLFVSLGKCFRKTRTDGHTSRHLLGGQTVGGHRRWNSGRRSKAQERIRHRRHRNLGRQSFRADACPRLAQWRGFRPGACDGADTLPNAASKTASARGKRFGIASTCAKSTLENGTAETGGAATAGKHPTAERSSARDTASSRTADPGVAGRRLTREISAAMARPALDNNPRAPPDGFRRSSDIAAAPARSPNGCGSCHARNGAVARAPP